MAGPRCPNHHCFLVLTTTRGLGICPVSGARFKYKPSDQQGQRKKVMKMTLNGMMEVDEDSYIITENGEVTG